MTSKEQVYETVYKEIESVIDGETNETSVLANVAALLHERFAERFFWTGFYLVRNGELQLGPFQGPVACMHIQKGRGVCGTAWTEEKSIIVPDVEAFPGHIACSAHSRSEIVVPLFNSNKEVVGEIDIDSKYLNAFDEVDRLYLEKIAQLLTRTLYRTE